MRKTYALVSNPGYTNIIIPLFYLILILFLLPFYKGRDGTRTEREREIERGGEGERAGWMGRNKGKEGLSRQTVRGSKQGKGSAE